MPSKRQRDDDGSSRNGATDESNAVLLKIQVAQHHRAIKDSWKMDDQELLAEIAEFLDAPPVLSLDSTSVIGSTAPVTMRNGAWRNVPVALPGEGVVYVTATAASMTTGR